MRKIALDTETTGVDCDAGHRIIEIACIELVDGEHTGAIYHQYINPQRTMSESIMALHGITNEFLQVKPLFSEIVESFLAFIDGAELIIHHAPFDLGFLNKEVRLAMPNGKPIEERCQIIDTLIMAKAQYPRQKNNLSALAERLELKVMADDDHGCAMRDTMLTAQLYQYLTRNLL